MLATLKALCLHSLTITWAYVIIAAVVGYQLGQTAIGGLIGRFSRK